MNVGSSAVRCSIGPESDRGEYGDAPAETGRSTTVFGVGFAIPSGVSKGCYGVPSVTYQQQAGQARRLLRRIEAIVW